MVSWFHSRIQIDRRKLHFRFCLRPFSREVENLVHFILISFVWKFGVWFSFNFLRFGFFAVGLRRRLYAVSEKIKALSKDMEWILSPQSRLKCSRYKFRKTYNAMSRGKKHESHRIMWRVIEGVTHKKQRPKLFTSTLAAKGSCRGGRRSPNHFRTRGVQLGPTQGGVGGSPGGGGPGDPKKKQGTQKNQKGRVKKISGLRRDHKGPGGPFQCRLHFKVGDPLWGGHRP